MEKSKKSYKNNNPKTSAPAWNEECELLNGSCYVSDIQHYFKYVLKNIRDRYLLSFRNDIPK